MTVIERATFDWRAWRMKALWAVLCLAARPAAAINLQIDYTYDLPANGGSNFFGGGNPQGANGGAQAKAALEAAASFYSTILTDSFTAIQTPAQFHSSQFDGQVTWQWTETFNNPDTNAAVTVTNASIAANQYVIYAGARGLSGSTAGIGGPGGFSWSETPTGSFTQQEINQINGINATFQNQVEKRGQASGFSRWGGAITFDNDGTTSWFFDRLGTPSGNVTDFYSVAIHELGHTLGFGASTEWSALVSGSNFTGQNSKNLNGFNPVPLSPDLGHWANGTMSVVYGTSTSQEVVMDPVLLNGTRRRLTALDAAGLQDIGWSLGPGPTNSGDYNNNGVVDAGDYVLWRRYLGQNVALPNRAVAGSISAADYNVWRANFGNVASASGSGYLLMFGSLPEPASGAIATLVGIAACLIRIRRRKIS